MRVSDFDFHLPTESIAQEPTVERTAARLLHLVPATGAVAHARMANLPELLQPGDLLVVNDTQVFPARLLGRRATTGGAVECLLIGPAEPAPVGGAAALSTWEALMHPGQKLKVGARVMFEGPGVVLHGEVIGRGSFGRRTIRLWVEDDSGPAAVERAIDAIGHVPLPPYITRPDTSRDRSRYQTVFAARRGSVAAPTAGLHFTDDLLDRVRARGVEVAKLTLHVGYGTFQPIRVTEVEDHRLMPERYEINVATANALNRAIDAGRRIIAVGTTTTRTLEAVGIANDGRIAAGEGMTDLFIYPGFQFRIVRGLLTNFHLPKSSLLMLVCALAGRDHVLHAYAEAVAEGYRFYSYGDAMLIL